MTMTSATEYFVSCYGCPLSPPYCDHVMATGYNCSLYEIGGCGHWRLRYRCRIGDLTEKELEYFKQKNGIDHVDYDNHDEYDNYLLQSVNYLSLDSLEERNEHVQAREYFESYPEQHCEDPEILHMRNLEITAEQIRKLRYGETPLPYFADSKIARIFYKMEMSIVKKATRCRLGVIREEKAKPNGSIAELEAEEVRLKTDLKIKLQELRELQEVVFSLTAPPIIVAKSLASPITADTTGTESENVPLAMPKPAAKQKPKVTRNKDSKYEILTRAYLEQMAEEIMEAAPEKKLALQAKAANLTPMDIAVKITDQFKAKIENIASRVGKSQAWREKNETLKPAMASFYNNQTWLCDRICG